MIIRLNPRRPNFNIVIIGETLLFFSYKTLVAIEVTVDGKLRRLRTDTNWSRTTERHMNEVGVKNWERVSQEELEELASNII